MKKFIINESFQNLNLFFQKINFHSNDVFNLIDYHDSYRNLYPNYDENDNEYEDDYYFESKEEAYTTMNDVLETFNLLPNPTPIYRTIKVDSVDEIDYDYLGESWSFDRGSAIGFAITHAKGNVLISAKTTLDNIDWKRTIKNYFQFSNQYDGYDENELVVIDNDLITDVQITDLTE